MLSDDNKVKVMKDNFAEVLPYILDYNFTIPAEMHFTIASKIADHYQIDLDRPEGVNNFIKVIIRLVNAIVA